MSDTPPIREAGQVLTKAMEGDADQQAAALDVLTALLAFLFALIPAKFMALYDKAVSREGGNQLRGEPELVKILIGKFAKEPDKYYRAFNIYHSEI